MLLIIVYAILYSDEMKGAVDMDDSQKLDFILANMVTRDNLANMATKDDLADMENGLLKEFHTVRVWNRSMMDMIDLQNRLTRVEAKIC